MASIAIGDIHGRLPALDDLLSQLGPQLTERDTVVFLGDYIDRGAHSRECVDRIRRFREESPATVVALRGNHEDWMLKAMRDHTSHSWLLAMDVFPTIESYSTAAAKTLREAIAAIGSAALYEGPTPLPYEVFFDAVPAAHLEFFRSLPLFHENEDGVFTHAGLDVSAGPVQGQQAFALLMGTRDFVHTHAGPPVVVYGHRDNADIREGWPHPLVLEWTIGVDTISHGVLTAIRLPDRRIFQSARYRYRR